MARRAEFAAFQAAHPYPEAEVRALKARTAALIAAYGPTLASIPADLDRPPVIWRASDSSLMLWDGPEAPRMVVIPAGEFTMGSPDDEPNRRASEGPRHRVRIGYALAVSRYPITVGEFARFIADTRYDVGDNCTVYVSGKGWVELTGRDWRHPGFAQTADSPAVCISFDIATAYAAWLSKKTGHAYRLLSEAEYEYADRAGTTTAYWWGNASNLACGFVNGADLDLKAQFPAYFVPSDCHDGYVFTSLVDHFKANAFGLHDMTGNVWSWTADCWAETYLGAPADGSPRSSPNCREWVLRGGSWSSGPGYLRSAGRDEDVPGDRNHHDGFRLARSL